MILEIIRSIPDTTGANPIATIDNIRKVEDMDPDLVQQHERYHQCDRSCGTERDGACKAPKYLIAVWFYGHKEATRIALSGCGLTAYLLNNNGKTLRQIH